MVENNSTVYFLIPENPANTRISRKELDIILANPEYLKHFRFIFGPADAYKKYE